MNKLFIILVSIIINCFWLGLSAQDKIDVPKNSFTKKAIDAYESQKYDTAYSFILKDSALHYPVGQYYLGMMYRNGKGVKHDDSLAVFWYRKAAEKHTGAQSSLGWMYRKGYGVRKNDSIAAIWFKKASDSGNVNAQCNLGVMYEMGEGVVKNDSIAVSLYKKAAEKNYSIAQFNLGLFYSNNKGVAQNDSLAVFWYTKSANTGYSNAQCNLAWMYENGKGIMKSDSMAIIFYSLSAKQGNESAKNKLNILNNKINALHSQNKIKQKVSLSRKDTLYLKQKVHDYFGLKAEMNFTFSNRDVSKETKIKHDVPFNIKQVNKLEKKIQGNFNDADIYLKIGELYKYNYNNIMSQKYLFKAIELYKERVSAKPDSASSYDKLGNAYFYLGNYKEAMLQYDFAIKIDSNDSVAKICKAINALYSFDSVSTISCIKQNIIDMPDNIKSYDLIPLYYLLTGYSTILKMDSNIYLKNVKNKTIDELYDLGLIKTMLDKHKGDIQFELLYNITRQSLLFLKVTQETLMSGMEIDSSKLFIIDQKDKEELNRLEIFYTSCEKRKDLPNKYSIYKWLASVNYIKGDLKTAIYFINKAIKQKPLSKSTFEDNLSSDYDNLAGAYYLINDTVNYEKTIDKKFKLRTNINYTPSNFIEKAKLAFFHKNYDRAKLFCLDALSIDENFIDAHICLAAIDICKNNIKSALTRLDKAYKIKPDSEIIFLYEGICFLFNNDSTNANFCFQKAIELGALKENITNEFINMSFFSD